MSMENDRTKLKYFLYVRRSSESEDRQMASIEDQVAEMKKLAGILNLNVVDIVTESKSAKQPGRPEFNKMMERIYKGEANSILSWKLNRLARNPVDGGQISWMLQQGIIKHIQTYSTDFKPSDNVLMMQVEFGMANQYVKDLSVDTRRGQRRKAERGWYPASQLPIGYRHNPQERQITPGDEVIEDPVTHDILVSLWGKMLTGKYSIASIKREGDTLGLRSKKGAKLSYNAYAGIFTNEFYCGYFNWHDDESCSIRMRGKHQIIVTEEEFNVVQRFLGKHGKPTRLNQHDFPYRGLVNCGECGCSITPDQKIRATCTGCKTRFSIKTKTECSSCHVDVSEMSNPIILDKTYYGCTKKRGKCSQSAIEKMDFEKQAIEVLESISIPKEFYEWAVEAIQYMQDNEVDGQKNIQLHQKKRETELLNRLDSLVRMRADGEISSEELQKQKQATDKELQSVRSHIEQFHNNAINWVEKVDEYLNFASEVVDRFKNGTPETKTNILSYLGSNLVLIDKKLSVSVPKPLFGIKNTYETIKNEKDWFEPQKTLEKQGDSGPKRVPIELGLPRQDSNLRPIA